MYSARQVEERYGYDPRKTDLSRIPSWPEFVKAMNYCMMKQFCALEKGGRIAVLVGDIKKRGKLYSMIFELVKPGTIESVIIKMQHNCFSDRTSYSGKFIPIVHEYLLIVRKDEPLLIPITITNTRMVDMRDMTNPTWKDVVAAVMEDIRGEVTLDQLYEKIEHHNKAKNNTHWREKIRQTLGQHPKVFTSRERGVWQLQKTA